MGHIASCNFRIYGRKLGFDWTGEQGGRLSGRCEVQEERDAQGWEKQKEANKEKTEEEEKKTGWRWGKENAQNNSSSNKQTKPYLSIT